MKQQIVANQQLVSYNVFNPQGTKPLVFLHGWRSDKSIWNETALGLAQGPWIAYVLDLPGFGESPDPKNAFYVQDYAKVVADFIQKLNLEQSVLIGHSFGGRVSIKLVAQNPTLISKLILVDSAGIKLTKNNDEFRLLVKAIKPLFQPRFMHRLKAAIYKRIGAEDYLATPNLQQTFINVINEDLTGHLEQISQPTLVVWGKDDQATPLKYAKIMVEKIKQAKLVVLKKAGHFCFLDQPSDFAGVIKDFLN